MKKSTLLLRLFIVAAVFSPTLLFSQENGDLSTEKPLKEIVNKRTQNAKHFQGINGTITAEISPMSVHYKDVNGEWKDINTEIVPSNDQNYSFENRTNNIKSYYSNNGVLLETEAGKIKIGVNPELVLIDKNNVEKNLERHSSSSFGIVTGNSLVYSNAFLHGNIEYIVENDRIKNNLLLESLPTQLTSEDAFFGFSENIELPKGWTIASKGKAIEKNAQINGELQILNEKGRIVMSIPAPIVFDASLASPSGINPEMNVTYKIAKIENGYKLITMVPLNWLQSSERIYPITIDPTVEIFGTKGGNLNATASPINNGNYVFVGITSGQPKRAWVQFDISTIPSGSVINLVETQLVMTANGATTAEIMNINDVTGDKGNYPTGANPTAFADMGDGLYTSFTALGNATYGYYNLGANAVTDLTTNLPSGTFQYGVDMATQSTNFKTFNAFSSKLRVTYGAPCGTASTGTLDSTICYGASFDFNGTTYSGANNSGTETLISVAGCDSIIVTVNVTELSAITGILDTTICYGGSFDFNGTYYDGANNAGAETLTAVSGCDSIVVVTVTELAPITGVLDTTICNGGSFEFNGTMYDGMNNSGIEILTAVNGCDSIVNVTVTELVGINTATTTNDFTITANLSGAIYQWVDCNDNNAPILGETNQSFTATANGSYAVIITDGSCSSTSNCETITTVGVVENDFENGLVVNPNPTDGNFSIDMGKNYNLVSISITDLNGRIVESRVFNNAQLLDLSIAAPAGVYLLNIQSGESRAIIRLVKK